MNAEIQELKVSVYPNPVINNQINVTTNRDIQSIKILTIVGSVVLDQEYETGITNVQLDLDKLSKGLYLLKIKFDEEKHLHGKDNGEINLKPGSNDPGFFWIAASFPYFTDSALEKWTTVWCVTPSLNHAKF